MIERLKQHLVRVYATADPRSLGLFRVALGLLLFVDVARRWPDLAAHYSNEGWLPNHFALFRPMSNHLFSVYLAFGTLPEVRVLVVAHLLVSVCLIVGYRTKLMQVASAVLITSINCRNILLENGGWVVLNLLAVWSAFLPLGRRYSVDAFVASWRRWREGSVAELSDRAPSRHVTTPVVSLAVTALIGQWFVIYLFNVVHKDGRPWRDGTAVYYFFQQDRMVTLFGAWVREWLPLWAIKGMTWSTLVIESVICLSLVLPVYSRTARKVAWVLIAALHLTIDSVVQLGPFSWAMVIMSFALVPTPEDWAVLHTRLMARRAARTLYVDPQSAWSLWFGRIVARFDSLGLVTFAPLDEATELPAGLDLPSARATLVVSGGPGSWWTGSAAFARLCDALPWPRPIATLVTAVGGGLVARAFSRPIAAAQYLQLPAPGAGEVRDEVGWERSWHAFKHLFAQLGVALLLIAATSQVLVENRAIPARFKPQHRPDWLEAIVVYPRLFQGWSMFAPAPPADDGRLVVDGRTRDGRHLDPLTGQEPSFEVQPKQGFRMNQIWGDFHRRIAEPRFSQYLPGVKDMLLRYHEITGRPQDQIVAFDLWHVVEQIPPPGQPKPPADRRKLLSHGTMTP